MDMGELGNVWDGPLRSCLAISCCLYKRDFNTGPILPSVVLKYHPLALTVTPALGCGETALRVNQMVRIFISLGGLMRISL